MELINSSESFVYYRIRRKRRKADNLLKILISKINTKCDLDLFRLLQNL